LVQQLHKGAFDLNPELGRQVEGRKPRWRGI
jgi:hypothetical protein